MRLRWSCVAVSILVALLGGAGLWLIVVELDVGPTQPAQVVFFVSLGMTLAGLAVPVAAYLNVRFAQRGWQARDRWRLVRQGFEVAFFGVVAIWLQKQRLLNWTDAVIVIAVIALMEVFFVTRTYGE